MNDERNLNTSEHAADELDALLSALQAGDAPPATEHLSEDDVKLARHIVALVREDEPGDEFVVNLEKELKSPKDYSKPTRPLWPLLGGLVAAMVVFAVVGVLLTRDDDDRTDAVQSSGVSTQVAQQPTATSPPPTMTPLVVAATQPALDVLTREAQVRLSPTPMASTTLMSYHQPTRTQTPAPTQTPSPTNSSTPEPTMTLTTTLAAYPTQPSIFGKPTWSPTPAPTQEPAIAFTSTMVGQQPPSTATGIPTLAAQTFLPDTSYRNVIQVHTDDGLPVLGAQVWIRTTNGSLVTQLTTTAAGRAYFFPSVYSDFANETQFLVEVSKDAVTEAFTLTPLEMEAVWEVVLDVEPTQPPVNLDVLFLVDAGLNREIRELKGNIGNIWQQVDRLPTRPDVRFGLVIYNDDMTQSYGLTTDVDQFAADPSVVDESGRALHVAVNEINWRSRETVRLIILIGEAPPIIENTSALKDVITQGIKIHVITDGEQVFRQLAEHTGGRFVPLSDSVDQQIVRLIAEELAALETPHP